MSEVLGPEGAVGHALAVAWIGVGVTEDDEAFDGDGKEGGGEESEESESGEQQGQGRWPHCGMKSKDKQGQALEAIWPDLYW